MLLIVKSRSVVCRCGISNRSSVFLFVCAWKMLEKEWPDITWASYLCWVCFWGWAWEEMRFFRRSVLKHIYHSVHSGLWRRGKVVWHEICHLVLHIYVTKLFGGHWNWDLLFRLWELLAVGVKSTNVSAPHCEINNFCIALQTFPLTVCNLTEIIALGEKMTFNLTVPQIYWFFTKVNFI